MKHERELCRCGCTTVTDTALNYYDCKVDVKEPEGRILQDLANLEGIIKDLESYIEDVVKRLNPILTSYEAPKENPNVQATSPFPVCSEVSTKIKNNIENLSKIRNIIGCLYNSIDL